jgi:AraC-like DNA-binding protein
VQTTVLPLRDDQSRLRTDPNGSGPLKRPSGLFFHRELRRGLSLHAGDVLEEPMTGVPGAQEAGLSCIFFLDGQVAARFGDRRVEFRGGGARGAIDATAVLRSRRESFQRINDRRQVVQHVVVTATPEWLDGEGLDLSGARPGDALCRHPHLATFRWTPNARLTSLLHGVFQPSVYVPELQPLYFEGHAIGIVVETLAAMLQAEHGPATPRGLSRHDSARLQRARDYIAAHLDVSLTVAQVAREAGASPSALQRLFRRVEGCSLFDYVRRLRLEGAHAALCREGISVQAASALAGYTSAANFATAFRRAYGITPTEARQRSKGGV